MIVVQDLRGLLEMADSIERSDILYFDIESTGLDPYTNRLALISIRAEGKTYVVNAVSIGEDIVMSYLKPIMENPSITKVAHNAVFDWKWFYHNNVYTAPISCTLINEQIIQSGLLISGFGLDDLAERYLKLTVDKTVRSSFINRDLSVPFTQEELEYSAHDVDLLEPIFALQLKQLAKEDMTSVYEWESRLIPITSRLEYEGININKEALEAARPVVQDIIDKASKDLQNSIIKNGLADQIVFDKDGFTAINLGSPLQMLGIFNSLGINVKSLGKKDLSDWDAQWARKNAKQLIHDRASADDSGIVDDMHIGFSHPILRSHAIRTAAAKLEGTYINGLLERINPVTGRIHPGFKQCGAVSTGRFSSVAPNFQNIPNKRKLEALGLGNHDIRSMFIPSQGRDFIISDYSGIELSILAAMSNDKQLIYQIIQGDIHSFVANNLCGDKIIKVLGEVITDKNKKANKTAKSIRDLFKPVSYGIIYGSTGYNLYRTLYFDLLSLGITITQDDADRWVERWKHELFPDTGALLSENAQHAITRYYTRSALGRRRHWTPDIRMDKWRMFAAMREGSNQPIQATCSDMIKIAMVNLDQELDLSRGRLVACIHDELLSETDHDYTQQAMQTIKQVMENAACMLFPNADARLFIAEPKSSDKYDK